VAKKKVDSHPDGCTCPYHMVHLVGTNRQIYEEALAKQGILLAPLIASIRASRILSARDYNMTINTRDDDLHFRLRRRAR
jgi:hypothetical protein